MIHTQISFVCVFLASYCLAEPINFIKNLPSWDCHYPNYGFELADDFKTGYQYGTEDVEINYDLNILVNSVGLREPLFEKLHKPRDQANGKIEFRGVYIYHLNDQGQFTNDQPPVKIQIDDLNAHGVDIYKIDSTTARIFIVSHNLYESSFVNDQTKTSVEEIAYFDYDVKTREIPKPDQIFRIRSPLNWAGNDVAAIAPNKILVSQFLPIPFSEWAEADSDTGPTQVTYLEFDENKVISEMTEYGDQIFLRPVISETALIEGIDNANGIQFDFFNNLIYVSSHSTSKVHVYQWDRNPETIPIFQKFLHMPPNTITDNLSFSRDGRFLYVAGIYDIRDTLFVDNSFNLKSMVVRFDLEHGDERKFLLLDHEGFFSASTVVENEGNLILGSPFKNVIVCYPDEDDENNFGWKLSDWDFPVFEFLKKMVTAVQNNLA